MKTGYTNLAGKCLISCASSNERAVIVVVLGSTNRKIWGESLKYLRWALEEV
jgi:D-alanyl-D-alanine carboxypeptidase